MELFKVENESDKTALINFTISRWPVGALWINGARDDIACPVITNHGLPEYIIGSTDCLEEYYIYCEIDSPIT
jgi:hypothetical protein